MHYGNVAWRLEPRDGMKRRSIVWPVCMHPRPRRETLARRAHGLSDTGVSVLRAHARRADIMVYGSINSAVSEYGVIAQGQDGA